MENDQYKGPERRTYFRVFYPSAKRPEIRISNHAYPIADISQGGIRFFNGNELKLKQRVHGTVTFRDGASIAVEGTIEWEQDDQFGLLLTDLIAPARIEKERKWVILYAVV